MIATLTETTLDRKVASTPRQLTYREQRAYDRIPRCVEFVDHPSFSVRASEKKMFGPKAKQISVVPYVLAQEVPDSTPNRMSPRTPLTPEAEQQLFLRYNHAKHRLSALCAAQHRRFSAKRAREMIRWHRRALHARSQIAHANMSLVVTMAKRTRIPAVEFEDQVSEGCLALLRSIEKFDVSRGFKFSTYACRAILKSFGRLATKLSRYRQRFPVAYDSDLERSDYDVMRHEIQLQDALGELRTVLSRNTAQLTDTERMIILARFPVASQEKKRTFSEIGRTAGLSTERVRQVQLNALAKLREAMNYA